MFSGGIEMKYWATQPAITYSKLTVETLEPGVKHNQEKNLLN